MEYVLIGCGGVDAYREMLPFALESGVTPVMIKETVYQATDYLGYGRMLPLLNVTNEVFADRSIHLPLPGQVTTTMENRLEKGVAENFLIRVVSQCLSYIGYPRSLNAINCIQKVAE